MTKTEDIKAAKPTPQTKTLKELIAEIYPSSAEVNKFLAYVNAERRKEAKKKDKPTPVTNNTDTQLISLVNKFWNLGLVIDGINVVITGNEMAMVTVHGYKNKVKQTYPDAVFDVQLVRKDDTFSFSKQDGKVSYSHTFGNPFENTEIIGAYCVIKIGDQDYFEALNRRDYEEMKKSSKQSYLWDKWESEFVLKSVIKRACKRHFNDEVAEIEKVDNEDYGVVDDVPRQHDTESGKSAALERTQRAIEKAKELENADI